MTYIGTRHLGAIEMRWLNFSGLVRHTWLKECETLL